MRIARCPSIRLSVRLTRSCIVSMQTAEDIAKLLCRTGSAVLLVFDSEHRYPIPRGIPSTGAQNTWRWEHLRFSSEIAVYLGNGTR